MKPAFEVSRISFAELDAADARNREAAHRFHNKLDHFLQTIGPEQLEILLVGGDVLLPVEKYLQAEMGASVRRIPTGAAALRAFRSEHAELVVIESHLPDMSVQDFARRVRDLAGGTPMATIVVANDQQGVDQVRSLKDVDSAVKRPMLITEFIQVVKKLYNLKDTGAFRALVQVG